MKIEIISKVYLEGDHWYDDTRFYDYIVELDGHDNPYKMTKVYEPRKYPHVEEGDKITCLINEDRLKNVKVLREIE